MQQLNLNNYIIEQIKEDIDRSLREGTTYITMRYYIILPSHTGSASNEKTDNEVEKVTKTEESQIIIHINDYIIHIIHH